MIAFVGLSHLGIVWSVAAASKGLDVVCHDPDAELCARLESGSLPIVEPLLPELFEASRSRMRFTPDRALLRQCEMIVIARDVPTTDENVSDHGALDALIDASVDEAPRGAVVVLLSQVPPGFTRRRVTAIERRRSDLSPSFFCQVETLIFGRAVERVLHPEVFIVGCADPAAPLPDRYRRFLSHWDCPVLPMRYESAELAKISINVCLVASISAANTLAETCEHEGADWSEIAAALRLDRRIGPHAYLAPGLGVAGGNLERDLATVRALARETGADSGVVDAFVAHSDHRRGWVLKALHEAVLSRNDDAVIAVWGLAYKPDTASTKNSPALLLIDTLSRFRLQLYDPSVKLGASLPARAAEARSALGACDSADALVIMTPWREFSTIPLREVLDRMAGRVIVDPFGALDGAHVAQHDVRYHRLGRRPMLGGAS